MQIKTIGRLAAIISIIALIFTAFTVPFQDTAVAAAAVGDEIKLIPGGESFGMRIDAAGVVVTGISEIDSGGNKISPAQNAGIKKGDIILMINNKETNSYYDVVNTVEKSGNADIVLTIMRNGEKISIKLRPAKSDADGKYKCGIWIRDRAAGIGTITYIDPATGEFGGLGHGIYDTESRVLMPMRSGDVFNVIHSETIKGEKGKPGELRGIFGTKNLGILTANTECGVFGMLNQEGLNITSSNFIGIASKDEIKPGKATIYSTLSDGVKREYEIEIEKIGPGNGEAKNMLIHVTDEKLLNETGGIIQGMSGSPIIQNGKLIGAVTHVLVTDPTRGYGIFIENMIKCRPKVAA